MKTLEQVLDEDEQLMRDARADALPAEYYRETLDAAVPIFREDNFLAMGAIPTTTVNKPWVKKSRRLKVLDISTAQHGESGVGGNFDRVDIDPEDEIVYRIWHNIQVEDIDQAGYENPDGNAVDFDLFRESGIAGGEKIRELQNKALIAELGKFKGLTKKTGIQTYAAGAAWTVAGQAKKDVIKVVKNKLPTKNVPAGGVALGVSPGDSENLFTHFSSTSTEQIEQIGRNVPGGVYTHNQFPTGKAYFWAKSPTVMECRVLEPLRVIPLPKVDEHQRMRLRTSFAFHLKKADGIVEVTGI